MIARIILGWVLTLGDPSVNELAAGAYRTAPHDLKAETALDHARAASIAARVYDVDPALLLAISHHESRYVLATVTPEADGKVSCGVMTPVPTWSSKECAAATASLLGGYLAGAAHLRAWLTAERGNLWWALTGYAGGGENGLIGICRQDDSYRACHTPAVFLERAARIRWRPAS